MADVLYDKESDEAFRAYLSKGEIRLQCCSDCKGFRYPPRFACPHCLSRKWHWEKVSGEGVIETYLWYCQPVDPRFADVPYNVAVVRLAEGPAIYANITDAVLDDLKIGQPVWANIETRNGRPRLSFVRENPS
ncbi:OB-fold domain-containing protein [Chelativorans sp. Marseille-P2723]|uniref:Zn-ribbon domain-containing OB-fold protein n=1 Tax=Chelativorans sp. Marseille-P2723 TaxID=2709133 RepID=UPI0015700544|nr:OB-fold domain-containing protein [Chelativorans sp. Marseille-P2723]